MYDPALETAPPADYLSDETWCAPAGAGPVFDNAKAYMAYTLPTRLWRAKRISSGGLWHGRNGDGHAHNCAVEACADGLRGCRLRCVFGAICGPCWGAAALHAVLDQLARTLPWAVYKTNKELEQSVCAATANGPDSSASAAAVDIVMQQCKEKPARPLCFT
ncbi:hypothetical protein B0H17DRAFT_1140979 [Mycena rosella]|uniref:Uncharacterized protein n=1 Tax=Mycena rosella TaxID=1033263 RepID=A0AAD7D0P8_MYCRO|nr:hypothetical protein B0H17DRAFT_1140979 [Mycena rosella]